MKIIHTGDWHIGKIVNEISMLEDQRYILNKLIKLIEEEKPDALIITGDLYDRSVPPAVAVELLDEYIDKILIGLKTPILAIAGNHDSPERLSFASNILRDQGFYMEGIFKKEINKVVLKDNYGEVNFYLVPYVDPAVVRFMYEDNSIRTHDDAMKAIIGRIEEKMDKDSRNILITHGYITFMSDESNSQALNEVAIDCDNNLIRAGLNISDSERPLSIGGTDLISGKHFENFNYVALGHLHGAQKVGSDKIRYSGSLLKYSFSEERQKKSVTIVEIDQNGEVDVRLADLKPLRDMRVIAGTIDELTNKTYYEKSNKEDYVFANITDNGEVLEPMVKLRAIYPNIMGLRKVEQTDFEIGSNSLRDRHENRSKTELFKEFYENIVLKKLTEEKKMIIEKVEEAINREETK
ncbi:Exodeoxyribonuclease I subunit D [Clostridium cavendishii DSM 21758]|uniref:Nuclease SbcCD subunit D n=1 Tax=Clostridium cavendishii DSM 21758 TaxID=1121302 RepID=A0A1M6SSW1_9CLOT|nr:exonuclease SbcCD subunit D [Clostridium cavendishii]SHK47822.1 Exodeoxyribonuclease I subunit D [Clostridium cavendishii DSM 21758]